MSYRDVRNFLEMLRALGYPALVSLESFRTPNFQLISDLLIWLSKRFDPDADLPQEIATEDQRVKLIRTSAEFMALKANIKLNTKKLYQADGYAVRELLKITNLLYRALNSNFEDDEKGENFDEISLNLRDFDLTDKANELKLSRQLASEITSTGARLFDLLGKEADLRQSRSKSVNRQFELGDLEADLKKAQDLIRAEMEEAKSMIDNVSATESSLDAKIERRRVEIDRYEKRLQTLKKVRPAFLEEFTGLEEELEGLFVQYSVRLRILNQLEENFAISERAQVEKELQMGAHPKIETIPLSDSENPDLSSPGTGVDLDSRGSKHQDRPRASTGGRSRTAVKNPNNSRAYGGMQPPMSDFSSDSDTDDLFIDKDESELMQSDDESLALEMSEISKSRVQTSKKIEDNDSDDEF